MVEYEGSKVLLVGIEYLKILDGKKVGCFSRPFLIARILGLSVR
jgi:hypothetical protein